MAHSDDGTTTPELDALVLRALRGLREPVQCMDVYRVLRDDLYALVCKSVSSLCDRGDVMRTPQGYLAARHDGEVAASRPVSPDSSAPQPIGEQGVTAPTAPPQPADAVAASASEPPASSAQTEVAVAEAAEDPEPTDSGDQAVPEEPCSDTLLGQLVDVRGRMSTLFGQELCVPLRREQSVGMLDVSRRALEFMARRGILTVGALVANVDALAKDAPTDAAVQEITEALTRHAKPLPAWMDAAAINLAMLAGSRHFAFNHLGILVALSGAQTERLRKAFEFMHQADFPAPSASLAQSLTSSCSAQARQIVTDLLAGGDLAGLAATIAPLVQDDCFAVVYAPYADQKLKKHCSAPAIKKLISGDLMASLEVNDACLSLLAQRCAEVADASQQRRVAVDTRTFWIRAAQRLARSSQYLAYVPQTLVISPIPAGEQAAPAQVDTPVEEVQGPAPTQASADNSPELDYDALIGGDGVGGDDAPAESAAAGVAEEASPADASQLLPGEPVDPSNVFAARMTIPEWLETRPADEREGLKVQLENEYATDIAKALGCTVMEATSARNKARRLFQAQCCFREDDFTYLYKTYDVSLEMFEWLTGLGKLSYGYLRLLYDGGHKRLTYAAIDKRLSEQVRERIRLRVQTMGTSGLSGVSVSPAQREFFVAQFTGVRYVSLEVLKARYEDKFGAGSAKDVTDRLLESLGYKVSEPLVVPSATDVGDLMGSLLDEREHFSLAELGEAVTSHRLFKRAFEERLKRFAIVRTSDDWYVKSQSLERSCGVTVSMLSTYLLGAYSFARAGEPFTSRSLQHAGYKHQLDALRDEAGLEDVFFDGILYVGVLQGLLRSSKVCGVRVYLKGPGEDVTFESLVTFLVRKRGPQEVYDLRKTLGEEYGIEMREADLRSRVNNQTDLYLNESLDTVYLTREQSVQAARDIMSGKEETGA